MALMALPFTADDITTVNQNYDFGLGDSLGCGSGCV